MTKIRALLGGIVDENNGNILVQLRGDCGAKFAIQFDRECLPIVIAALAGLMRQSSQMFPEVKDFQPSKLTNTRPIEDRNGNAHLELELDYYLPIPLVLDMGSTVQLQTALVEIQKSGKLRSKENDN